MICDRISKNAESLAWSYGRKAARSTLKTVLSTQGLVGTKPIEETTDWDGSKLENYAPCSQYTFSGLAFSHLYAQLPSILSNNAGKTVKFY